MDTTRRPVTIVGAGLAGAACAVALRAAGVEVTVVERGRAPGGRMAAPTVHGRRVDLGAAYFTVADPGFAAVTDRWQRAGLARPWTDTFQVVSSDGRRSSTGPTRWAAPDGLRSLVRDLLTDIDVRTGTEVSEGLGDRTVLAMPDPQAARLAAVRDPVTFRPTIAVACGYAERRWSLVDACFVNDHPDIEFVADDGTRRGDSAPVLVAHTTAALAGRHLEDPDAVAQPVAAALSELFDAPTPDWTHVHRWTFAKPADPHRLPYGRAVTPDGIPVALAGDQWCPQGNPRVESAWLSGHRLGIAIAAGDPVFGEAA